MLSKENRETVIDTGEGMSNIPGLNLYEGNLIFNGEQINVIKLAVENALRGTIVNLTDEQTNLGEQVIEKIASVNE